MFFFFNPPATAKLYTLSLHDALPIFSISSRVVGTWPRRSCCRWPVIAAWTSRSEEHTSELQSRLHLVCRLLLEKKKVITEVEGSAHLTVYYQFVLAADAPIGPGLLIR